MVRKRARAAWDPWYCADCAVSVPVGDRCKVCGQTEREQMRKVVAHDRAALAKEKTP